MTTRTHTHPRKGRTGSAALGGAALLGALTLFASPAYALDLAVSVTEDDPIPNGYVHYRLVVSNVTTGSLSNVTLSASVPADMSADLRSVFAPGMTASCASGRSPCAAGTGVNVSVGALGVGESRSVQLTYFIRAAASGTRSVSVVAAATGQADVTRSQAFTIQPTRSGSLALAPSAILVEPTGEVRVDIPFGNTSGSGWAMTTLRVDLPTGVVVSNSGGGTVTGTRIEWAIGTLTAGSVGERSFVFEPPTGAAAGDLLRFTAVLADGATTRAESSEVVAVASGLGLDLVAARVETNDVASGRTHYRVVVANTGSSDALDVRLHALAGGYTFISRPNQVRANVAITCPEVTSQPSCTSVEWATTGPQTIPPGEHRVFIVPLTTSSSFPTGSVSAPRFHVTSTSLPGVLGARVSRAFANDGRLSLVLTPREEVSVPGELVPYDLSLGYASTNPAALTNLTLRVDFPPGLVVERASPAPGSQSSGVASWSIPSLRPGDALLRTLWLRTPSTAAAGTVYSARAELLGGPAPARSESAVAVGAARSLDVRVVEDGSHRPRDGATIYRVVVSNPSPAPVSGVRLAAHFSEFSIFITDMARTFGTAPTCPDIISQSRCVATEWTTWPSFDVPAGGQVVHYVPVYSTGAAGLVSRVSFEVGTGPRIRRSVQRPLLGIAARDELLSFGLTQHAVGFGETVEAEIVVANVLGTLAAGQRLEVDLPTEIYGVVAEDGGSAVGADRLRWTLPSLAAGQSAVRRFRFRVGTSTVVAAGSLREFEARLVDPSTDEVRFRASDVVRVGAAPALRIDLQPAMDPTPTGDTSWWQLAVRNEGSQAISGIELSVLPPWTGFLLRLAQAVPPASSCPSILSSSTCLYSEWIRWTPAALGTLPAGATRVIDLPLGLYSGAHGPVEVHATARAGSEVVGVSRAIRMVPAAGLELGVSLSDQLIEPGARRRIEVAFANGGVARTGQVDLVVELPPGLSTVRSAHRGATVSGRVVRWPLYNPSLTDIPVGRTGARWLEVEADSGLPDAAALPVRAALVGASGPVARSEDFAIVRRAPGLAAAADIEETPVPHRNDLDRHRYIVTNPSSSGRTDVRLRVMPPRASQLIRAVMAQPSLPPAGVSARFTCPNIYNANTCVHGEWITGELGSLQAGETRSAGVPTTGPSTLVSGRLHMGRFRAEDVNGDFVRGRRFFVRADDTEGLELRADFDEPNTESPGTRTLRILVGNTNMRAASGLVLYVSLQPGLALARGQPTLVPTNAGFLLPLGALPGGQWAQLDVQLDVASGLPAGSLVGARVWVESDDPVAGPIAETSAHVVVRSVTVPRSDPIFSLSGTTLTLTSSVANVGRIGRTDARVQVRLPRHASVGTANLSMGATCPYISILYGCDWYEWISWPTTTLARGAQLTRQVRAFVSDAPPGRLLSADFAYSDSNAPRQEIVVTRTVGVGTRYVIPDQTTIDTDLDGFSDVWEIRYGFDHLDPLDVNPQADPDRDGLTNDQEHTFGTNPNNPDTDGDLLMDGWEVMFACVDALVPDANEDPDGDGRTNLVEQAQGTNPCVSDRQNQPPVINRADATACVVGRSFELVGEAVDPDMDPLTYRWEELSSSGVAIANPTSARTPVTSPATPQDLRLRFTVSDGTSTLARDVEVPCIANRAPIVAASATPAAPRVGDMVRLFAAATDVDGDRLTYQWREVTQTGIQVTGADGAEASVTPLNPGRLEFAVTVSDGLSSVSASVEVTVMPADGGGNRPPVVSVRPPAASLTVGSPFSLVAEAMDPDGDGLTFAWEELSMRNASLSGTNSDTLTVTPAASGLHEFRVTVSDGQTSANAAVSVMVQSSAEPGLPPTLSARGVSVVYVGGFGYLTVEATDPDGPDEALTYRWSPRGQPAGAIDGRSDLPGAWFRAPGREQVKDLNPLPTLSFEVTVTDASGLTAVGTVEVAMVWGTGDENQDVLAFADARIEQGRGVLDGSRSRPDGVECAWRQLSGPSVLITNANTCLAGFEPPMSSGELIFVLEVRKGGTGASSVARVTFQTDGTGGLSIPEPVANPELPPVDDSGCSCSSTEASGRSSPTSGFALVLLLGAVALRRRNGSGLVC